MTSAPTVQKYGGSSVADIQRLRRIADKLARQAQSGRPLVVVVSAMGKTTSQLLELAEQARQAGGAERPIQRELDMLVSTGERVTMSLLAIILQGLGARALSFTGSQSGIITTETHFNSKVVEVRPRRIVDALRSGHIAVVAGYQGMSRSGEITTLGRGGSDTTAVALAGALDADACEIYSDVDGVYTADPRCVPGARHLPRLDYEFMWQMANAGARVLNQEAIRLGRDSGVPIVARQTFPSASAQRETWVTSDPTPESCRAVVDFHDLLEVSGPRTEHTMLVEQAHAAGINVSDAQMFPRRFAAWMRRDPVALQLLSTLHSRGVRYDATRSLLSLIGSQSESCPARAELALAGKLVHRGPGRQSVLVSRNAAKAMTERLHRLYVEAASLRQSA